MNREEFRTLDVAGRLPTPNAVALKLLRLLKSDTVSAQEIARAIKCDPALAGRVIGAANSIATRGPRPVASALEALARVGTAATCRLALGFSVLSTNRSGPCSHFDYRQFWVRSLLMGITMQTLATRTRIVAPEESFTVGLLAEIGQLALATLFPDTYGTELAQVPASDRLGRIGVERAAFATDHVELGQLLLSAWGFPETLIEPVACYGRGGFDTLPPGSRRFLFAESLRLAELTARTAIEPAARDELMDEILETIETLELSRDALRGLGDEVSSAWPVWARLLDLDAMDLGRIELHPGAPRVTQSANDASASPPPTPNTIRMLVVSGDEVVRAELAALGDESGVTLTFARDVESALGETLRAAPQFILFHWQNEAPDGLDFCRMLRQSAIGSSAYIIVLGDAHRDRALIDALDAGADDLVPWPAARNVLAARVRVGRRIVALQQALAHDRDQLRRYAADQSVANRRLREVARSDPLTGLPNRRHAMDQLDIEWQIAQRTGTPLACLMIDIDHFKRINDNFGHAVGDEVLTRVAAILRDAARASDTVCRIGGEEFLVICRNSERPAAMQCAERLRIAVANARIVTVARTHEVTISIGVAVTHEPQATDLHALLECADRALYGAKRDGRDRVAGAA